MYFISNFNLLQVDISPEELHNSVTAEVGIQGDVKVSVDLLVKSLESSNWKFDKSSSWWNQLKTKCASNKSTIEVQCEIRKSVYIDSEPYYQTSET